MPTYDDIARGSELFADAVAAAIREGAEPDDLLAFGHVPQGGVTVHHPDQFLSAGSLQQHLLA